MTVNESNLDRLIRGGIAVAALGTGLAVGGVLNPVGEGALKSRVSLPLFLHPRREIRLSDRYTVGSYFEERMQELRRKG